MNCVRVHKYMIPSTTTSITPDKEQVFRVCVNKNTSSVVEYRILTFTMLAYSKLIYSLKCAPAGRAGSHFCGYFNVQ